MAREYDLSDPTDLEVLKSDFEFYTADEWQGFIDWSLLPENKKQKKGYHLFFPVRFWPESVFLYFD